MPQGKDSRHLRMCQGNNHSVSDQNPAPTTDTGIQTDTHTKVQTQGRKVICTHMHVRIHMHKLTQVSTHVSRGTKTHTGPARHSVVPRQHRYTTSTIIRWENLPTCRPVKCSTNPTLTRLIPPPDNTQKHTQTLASLSCTLSVDPFTTNVPLQTQFRHT